MTCFWLASGWNIFSPFYLFDSLISFVWVFFFYFYLPLRDWLNQFSHVLDFYSAVPQSDLTWVVCWYYAAALSLYSFPGASLLLPAMCVSVSDPPDKLFYALYSQKRLSSLCLHQESSSRLWTQRGQATQTTRHIVTPIDQMLSSFFFLSVFPVPPVWHSLWRCCFIPFSWWESVLLLWDVCLSHSTIKGPACTRVCLAWTSVVDEWAVRARSSWKQALSNRIPWRRRSQWGDERSARNGQAR